MKPQFRIQKVDDCDGIGMRAYKCSLYSSNSRRIFTFFSTSSKQTLLLKIKEFKIAVSNRRNFEGAYSAKDKVVFYCLSHKGQSLGFTNLYKDVKEFMKVYNSLCACAVEAEILNLT